jgi:UDP-GlcNAc:undecaprenyl-phosphate GlcNAc-1-phosphate transferase
VRDLLPLGVGAAVAAALAPAAQALARRLDLVDRPKEERWSKRPTPLLGGVALLGGVLAAAAAGGLPLGDPRVRAVGAGALLLFAVGLWDDVRGLRPSAKLAAQVAAAAVLVLGGVEVELVERRILAIPLTVFWVVGITNALNLLDNMDGLASGVGGIAALVLAALGASSGVPWLGALALGVAGAALGFLPWNVSPARQFLGDAGSLPLGFLLAAAGILGTYREAGNVLVVLAAPVCVLGVPILDTTLVTLARRLHGRKVSQGGKDHLSHRLVALGMGERRAVGILWTVTALFGGVALLVSPSVGPGDSAGPLLLLGLLAAGGAIFGVVLGEVKVYHPVPGGEPDRAERAAEARNAFRHYFRAVAVVFLDLGFILAAFVAAHLLRFEGRGEPFDRFRFFEALPVVVVAKVAALQAAGLQRGFWRYFGLRDLAAVGKGVLLGSALTAGGLWALYRFEGFSGKVLLLDGILLFLLLVGSRALFRLTVENLGAFPEDGAPVVLVGAGREGAGAAGRGRGRPLAVRGPRGDGEAPGRGPRGGREARPRPDRTPVLGDLTYPRGFESGCARRSGGAILRSSGRKRPGRKRCVRRRARPAARRAPEGGRKRNLGRSSSPRGFRASGAPRFRGRPGFPLLLAALAAAAARDARAQEAPPVPASAPVEAVPVERLRFESRCFFEVEGWRGREEPFLQRLQSQREAALASDEKRLAAVEELLARGLWLLKGELEGKQDMDGACRMANGIMDLRTETGEVGRLRGEADEFLLGVNLVKAEQAKGIGDYPRAKAMFALVLKTRRTEVRDRAITAIVEMEKDQAEVSRFWKGDDLVAEAEVLGRVLGALRTSLAEKYEVDLPVLRELKERKDEIDRTTQDVSVAALPVGPALSGFKGGKLSCDLARAGVVFEPLEGGKRFPAKGRDGRIPPSGRLRLVRGTYDVRVYSPDGGDRPAAVFLRVPVEDAPAAIEVPDLAPEGMVYVGPWTGGGGFFVDRSEVTVAQVRQFGGSDPLLTGARDSVASESNKGSDDPAWFWAENQALAFEKASGKRIPTAEQWIQAAFGPFPPAERPYPWGKEPPSSDRAYLSGSDSPKPAGQRPNGASPYGAEDMAGNLGEWVRQGNQLWGLGGSWQRTPSDLASFDGRNPLRDPQPGDAAFAALPGDQKGKYLKYKADSASYVMGLRMVIPVK